MTDFSLMDGGRILVAPFSQRKEVLKAAGMNQMAVADELRGATRYEVHTDYDFIAMSIPIFLAKPMRDCAYRSAHIELEAFLKGSVLLIFCDDEELRGMIAKAISALKDKQPDLALHALFSVILAGDGVYLEKFEDDIENMEDQVLKNPSKDFPEKVSELRKNLLAMHRYYEGFFDLLEDLEENQNGFISNGFLRAFHLLTNRVDRLSNLVTALREYLSQVREAYQNQIDINANQIMQFFTMIATIFLPLTLIVGWYGMNLHMPEYDNHLSYPIVTGVCVLIVLFCLWYFKKKKWF